MDNIKPSQMLHIGGGVLIALSTFLNWWSVGDGDFSASSNAWSTESYGLLGIILFAIGVVLAGGGIMTATGNDEQLPDQLLGLSRDQLHLALGFAAFVPTFSFQFADAAAIGVTLGWLGAAGVIASAMMEMKQDGPAAPTQF